MHRLCLPQLRSDFQHEDSFGTRGRCRRRSRRRFRNRTDDYSVEEKKNDRGWHVASISEVQSKI